jgi:hypothetical protein
LAAIMEIRIDSVGLSNIYAAGQAVTLTRQVNQAVDTQAAIAPLAIAWQVFDPLQTNTVAWADQYYCFMTTTPLVMNAVIKMNAQSGAPMQIGFVYQFAQGQFVKQQQRQGADAFIISNAMQGTYAFGMAQSATVNSVSTLAPFCAAPVLYNEAAYFIPSDVIRIFLSSANSAGTLLPPPSNSCTVVAEAGGGNDSTVGFNDQTNSFYVAA